MDKPTSSKNVYLYVNFIKNTTAISIFQPSPKKLMFTNTNDSRNSSWIQDAAVCFSNPDSWKEHQKTHFNKCSV